MSSSVDIANSALSKLGAERITSLADNSPAARAMNFRFEPLKTQELRKHLWNFAIKRVQLAADTATPAFGYAYQFTLPTDFLRFHPDNETQDYNLENGKLLSDSEGPFNMRYVANVTDTNLFDPLFDDALASRMAYDACEEVTQSNTKKEAAEVMYKDAIREAKMVDAIEDESEEAPEDEWITARI